jgi:hypothetical protein
VSWKAERLRTRNLLTLELPLVGSTDLVALVWEVAAWPFHKGMKDIPVRDSRQEILGDFHSLPLLAID